MKGTRGAESYHHENSNDDKTRFAGNMHHWVKMPKAGLLLKVDVMYATPFR